jgi:hypothetical protein
MSSFLDLSIVGLVLMAIQVIAALPWLLALNPLDIRKGMKSISFWSTVAVITVGGALAIGYLISNNRDSKTLTTAGRFYASFLHLQLAADFVSLLPQLLLTFWRKGGAVALAAFRESIRQPMFWLIGVLATMLIMASMVIPYFTFGEDYKMMKQLGFDAVMLSAALFGLLAASISISEEIEGRTAVTLMSKPVNRRQFLVGKYAGFLFACIAMTLILGWVLNWALFIKPHFDKLDDVNDTMPLEVRDVIAPTISSILSPEEWTSLSSGISSWFGEAIAHHAGMLLNFGQVMVLLAICVALATRIQFVVNLNICLLVFLLGHLSPVLVQVTSESDAQGTAVALINFIARLMNAVFPALDYFDMGPAIIRDLQLQFKEFVWYVITVTFYSVIYTAIGLVIGLLLFEDRDVA